MTPQTGSQAARGVCSYPLESCASEGVDDSLSGRDKARPENGADPLRGSSSP